MRRLPRFGWSIETAEGDLVAIRGDGGPTHPVVDRLMGTKEAARCLGVLPPNFVRDWASRADFPAPVANLSSGRVWLASDVERYETRRRAPKPTEERIAEIARRLAWWQDPKQTLARPLAFVARVMALGSLDEVRDVERFFGRRSLDEALIRASAGVFDRRSWNYWLLVLGRELATPLPVRNAP